MVNLNPVLICTKTTFINAAGRGDLKAVETHLNSRFFKKDWLANQNDAYGISALWLAARNGHTAVVECLIRAGADINLSRNYFKLSPLSIACWYGHADLVALLLKAKADIHRCNNEGNTPLHIAVIEKKVEIVQYLLQQGANTSIKNNDGKTPLDMLRDKNAAPIIELLKGHKNPVRTGPAKKATKKPKPLKPWTKISDEEVAHIRVYPELQRKITEIFNFSSRERVLVTENLRSKTEAVTPPESFDNIGEDTLQKAFDAFTQQKGVADAGFVFKHCRLDKQTGL